jgi:hypothetical protein
MATASTREAPLNAWVGQILRQHWKPQPLSEFAIAERRGVAQP